MTTRRIEQLLSEHRSAENGSGEVPVEVEWTSPCLICEGRLVTLGGSSIDDVSIELTCETYQQELLAWLDATQVAVDDQDKEIQEAARLLHEAKLPLICGLTDQSVETQHEAVLLAKSYDGVVDWTIGNGPVAFHRAQQTCGSVSCTYGEVTERCDLAIYWPGDLRESFQHFAKCFIAPKTKVLTIDWNRQQQQAAIRILRMLQAKLPTSSFDGSEFHSQLSQLFEQINSAEYPVILVNDSLAHSVGNAGVLALHRFVRAQNDVNRCRLVHLGNSNAAGISTTLTSLAGAPYGVGFRSGKSIFRGREYSVESLLGSNPTNPTADLVVLVGKATQLPKSLPPQTKVVWVCDQDEPEVSESLQADVVLRASRWGLDEGGMGYRADGIPVQREALMSSDLPSAATLLQQLSAASVR